MGADHAAGREQIGDFVQTFQEQVGRVGTRLWAPLGTTDFSPTLTTIAAEQPSFVYAFAGADAVRFLQQMQECRLQDLVKLVGPGTLFDQEDMVPTAGSAAPGGINTFQQSPTAPAADGFVKACPTARGRLPSEAGTAG